MGLFDDIGHFAEKAAKDVGHAAGDVGHALVHAEKAVGHKVEDLANDIAHGVEHEAKAIGGAFKGIPHSYRLFTGKLKNPLCAIAKGVDKSARVISSKDGNHLGGDMIMGGLTGIIAGAAAGPEAAPVAVPIGTATVAMGGLFKANNWAMKKLC